MALRGHATKGSVSGGTNLITKREGKIHSGGDVGLWRSIQEVRIPKMPSREHMR